MFRIAFMTLAVALFVSCQNAEESGNTDTQKTVATTETTATTKTTPTTQTTTTTKTTPTSKTTETTPTTKKSNKEPLVITDANFDELVTKSDKVVLIDFWAVWCGPCKRIAPIIKELAGEYDGKAVIAKLDVDKSKMVAAKYKIESIPTILIFKGGQPVEGLVGLHPKENIKAKLDKALAK